MNATADVSLLEPYQPAAQEFIKIRHTLEKILNENILPFWYPEVIDLENGGYYLNHDIRGERKGPSSKYLVTQARTLWFFSRLVRSAYGTEEHQQAARHGYDFLCNRMWDKQFGGFYWEVDATGKSAIKSHKHLYGQAFGLYAVSEYAMVFNDTKATVLARQIFGHLEDHAHDQRYGGYEEFFYRNWQGTPSDSSGYLNSAPGLKLMNTHVHLLEALSEYYLLTADNLARERLIELIFILSNTVVRKTLGACTDKYHQDWSPCRDDDRISYGHDLENIWLLVKACNVAGISNMPLLDLYKTLFNYSFQYGFDPKAGGFYASGHFNKSADNRVKIWWIQAETLVSALQMYSLTGAKIYFDCFLKTLDWIVKYQVDWEYGDWYAEVSKNGRPVGDKSGAWKGPYHNGRAMLQCLELLASLPNVDLRSGCPT